MNIQRLKSGSYRVRQMVDGVVYSATFDHYPDKNEILQNLSPPKHKQKRKKPTSSFEDYAKEYIELKEPVLSVTTISAYESILRNISPDFKKKVLEQISSVDVQKEINTYSATHSPKSTHNLNGFISAVIGLFSPQTHISTTLPKKPVVEPYTPLEEDVRNILLYMKVHAPQYYLPLALASCGLRRSEILCLTRDDLSEDDVLYINKAMVQNKDYQWMVKPTKTKAGTRKVKIPHEIAEELRKQGYAYSGHPDNINKYLVLAEKKLGLPHFSLHKLRHFYITTMHNLGIPDVLIAESCGHGDLQTTRRVYTHAQAPRLVAAQQYTSNYLTQNILFSAVSNEKMPSNTDNTATFLLEQTGVEPSPNQAEQ